jgi:uncharacterized membrane protein YfcA
MTVALVALGVLIGMSLGALGAGGSILAVPVLVHVAGLSVPTATATSLVAVGSAAALAASGHRNHVRVDVALWFVPTGFVGALIGASVGNHLDEHALLLAFSVLMLVAAQRMLGTRGARPRAMAAAVEHELSGHPSLPVASTARSTSTSKCREGATALVGATAGTVVGFLTGLFGVGGGFVIVPALTLAVGLAMPQAIATSLVIVAANAAIALAVRGVGAVDWPIAVALTAPMLAGSALGARLGRHLDPDNARLTFAALLVAVALLNAAAIPS